LIVEWLAVSLVLSVVLTVVLNIVIRAFPHTSERAAQSLAGYATRDGDGDRRARVYAPWKAMLVVSLILTIALNVWIWMT
jgi:hypothetical protein